MFFAVALIVGGWGVVGWGRKFWLVVSTGYFYILFLWAIVVSDFLTLEIQKHLVLPLSSITFTANSQADNHFCNYIYLFQILYSMKSVFYYFIKRVFMWKLETQLFAFSDIWLAHIFEASYSTGVTSVSKKSSVDQSELEK